MSEDIYSMEHKRAVLLLIVLLVLVSAGISSQCRICTIMANPPDWIDSWYDGPAKQFLPEKGPAG